MKLLLNAVVVAGLAVYAAAFAAVPLTGLAGNGEQPLRRFELLRQILLLPDEWLFAAWFGDPPQFAFFDRLPVLLVAGAILAWAAALGWLIVRLFVGGGASGPRLSRLETSVFSLGAGLAALGTWTLLMGLFGKLDRTWIFIVPAAATLLAAILLASKKPRPSVAPQRDGATAGRGFLTPQRDGATAGRGFLLDVLRPRWLWTATPFLLAILLAAMLPPADFDVREYHLQAPKEFFEQGRIAFLPHNVYANMPLGAEMLALLAMAVSGDWWLGALAGKTLIAAFTPLCALGLFAAGRRFFSVGAGVVAALVYVSVPWVIGVSTSGLIEGATACCLFLAVYAVLLGGARGAALAGLFAGAAVATKYPAALFVLAPLGVWIIVGSFTKRGTTLNDNSRGLTAPGGETPKSSARWMQFSYGYFLGGILKSAQRLVLYLLAAAAICGPWFAKNWAFTGNPVYPLLYEKFDGRTWNEEKDARWNRVHRPQDFTGQTLGKDLGRVFLTSPWLSPLVVPLAALALLGTLAKVKPLSGRHALILSLFAYFAFVIAAWWLFTHRIDRFWIPVLPAAALLAGAGACWNVDRWWRGLLRLMLAAGLAANFLAASSAVGYNAWFVPLDELRNDPHRIGAWHWYINTQLGEGGLLAVGDAAVFDLRRPVLYNTCFDDSLFERLVEGKTAEEIRAWLRERKIGYVFVNWGEIARYRSPGNYGFTDFVQPAAFDRLVAEGVLEPLPVKFQGDPGRAYRVK